jgi:hypothetical protein
LESIVLVLAWLMGVSYGRLRQRRRRDAGLPLLRMMPRLTWRRRDGHRLLRCPRFHCSCFSLQLTRIRSISVTWIVGFNMPYSYIPGMSVHEFLNLARSEGAMDLSCIRAGAVSLAVELEVSDNSIFFSLPFSRIPNGTRRDVFQ